MHLSSLNLAEPLSKHQSNATSFKKRITWAKQRFSTLLLEIQTLKQLASHPHSGAPAKVVAACSVAYLLSPIQIIPSFIPVIGQLDDLFVFYVAMRLTRRLAPPDVLRECQLKAQER
jgi:uncharacterized membrane protein YkvA (DUF1232 family)